MLESLFPPLSFLSLSPRLSLDPLTACGPGSAASQSAPCLSPINKGHAPHRENMLAEATHPRWFSADSLRTREQEIEAMFLFFIYYIVTTLCLNRKSIC